MELFGDFLLHPPTQYTRFQILTGDTGVNIRENFCCSRFSLDEHPAKQKSLKNLIKGLLNIDSSSFEIRFIQIVPRHFSEHIYSHSWVGLNV